MVMDTVHSRINTTDELFSTMNISSYHIPNLDCTVEFIQSKSRFLASMKRVTSLDEMRKNYLDAKRAHPKANHHCWAGIAGSPEDSSLYGFSDDGEPSGTAGKPIFNVLKHSGIGQCCIIVTRYFGGIKLGTGGLVKAYTEASKRVLEQTELTLFSEQITIQLTFPYDLEGRIRYLMDELSIGNVEFHHSHEVTALLQSDVNHEMDLIQRVRQISHLIDVQRRDEE